jgi:hypothetical protein
VCDLETSRIGAPYIYDVSNLRVNPEVGVCGAARGTCVVVWTRVIYIYAV